MHWVKSVSAYLNSKFSILHEIKSLEMYLQIRRALVHRLREWKIRLDLASDERMMLLAFAKETATRARNDPAKKKDFESRKQKDE